MSQSGARRAALICLLFLLLALETLWAGAQLSVIWCDKECAADLSGDGIPETLTLTRRTLTVSDASGVSVWQSEPGWRVQDFLIGDIDADGAPELLLLLYKRGSYGTARPFWVERDETSYSQHIFIYRWSAQSGAPRPIWMASALPVRVRAFSLEPDGLTLRLLTASGSTSLWRWHSFGLTRVDVGLPPKPAQRALPFGILPGAARTCQRLCLWTPPKGRSPFGNPSWGKEKGRVVGSAAGEEACRGKQRFWCVPPKGGEIWERG